MTPTDAAPDPLVRERLARALGPDFELLELLGRGGFAEVYEVRDNRLHRRLAVKVLRPDLAWTEGMLHRFEEEARSLARLSHPNILPIHFVGDTEGLVYYAMPFVEARSVGQLLRQQGPLDPETAVQLIRPILDALEHAHARGMIHRDIKPDNILVENGTGRPLLVDFGIARQMDGSPGTTGSGFVVGTPTYMSPEQALGQQNVDHRADLYAVGAMLYQMVTGQPPYEGETSQEVIGRHINDPIPSPGEVDEDIPEWLSNVVVHAMAKRPDERYQHAAEMAADLLDSNGGQVATSSTAKVRRWIRHDDPTAII
ncbi:MAG: serine/threonine-protein kinase, partial [Gemmatimonadales bacterium]